MSVYDPMLDHTVDKLKDGVKVLRHLDSHAAYVAYAPIIAASIAQCIKEYQEYLRSLEKDK